jgi:5-methylcytosine-specific restriction endonuclease McrA
MKCVICEVVLFDRQVKYCSVPCQTKSWKIRNRETYLAGKKAYRDKNREKIRKYNQEFKSRGIAKPLGGDTTKHIIQSRGSICSRCSNSGRLQVHHIKPLQNGGLNISNNLMILCWDCHMLWHKQLRNYWLPLKSESPLQ